MKFQNQKIFLETITFLFSATHVLVLIVIIFGFLLPQNWTYLYISVLSVTLLSWVLLGYCPLTKWEFDLRKKYSTFPEYHYEYLHYWGYKLFKININPKIIRIVGSIFLAVLIIVWLVTHLS